MISLENNIKAKQAPVSLINKKPIQTYWTTRNITLAAAGVVTVAIATAFAYLYFSNPQSSFCESVYNDHPSCTFAGK